MIDFVRILGGCCVGIIRDRKPAFYQVWVTRKLQMSTIIESIVTDSAVEPTETKKHWTCARKRFYIICIDGMDAQITSTYFMDDLDDDEDIEAYIDHLLSYEEPSAVGSNRQWFDCQKFVRMLRDPAQNDIVHQILDRIEDRDLDVRTTFENSSIDDRADHAFAKYYADHFLDDRPINYGFYKLKTAHNFLVLLSVTSFWMKEMGATQFGENGSGRVRDRTEFEAFSAGL